MFHSFFLGIPCLLDRSTSKEVQQHTQTLDLTWSVYGTACTAFSVYCTFPSQHFCAFSTLTVLCCTVFEIMAHTLFATSIFLMATLGTSVINENSDGDLADLAITWTIAELPLFPTITQRELRDFVQEHSTGTAQPNERLRKIGGLVATYNLPLVYNALQRLWTQGALWVNEALHAFHPNYALEWIDSVDTQFNYGTAYYYDIRYPAHSFEDSMITQPEITWDATPEDLRLNMTAEATTLNQLLYLTLFGTLALMTNKITLAEQLIYRGVTLSVNVLQHCHSQLAASGLVNDSATNMMTNSYFYMALPQVILTKATQTLLRKLEANLDPDYVFNTAKTLVLETSGLENPIKDWLAVTDEKNLHFTARGALLMALDNFKHLAPNSRAYYANQPIVLLRFKMDLRKTFDLQNLNNMWLWNRHYWEHSFAFNYDHWTFNLNEFRTLRTFVFNKTTPGQNYNFEDFGSLMDTFMTFTPNFVWNHHLPLPNTPGMVEHLEKLKKRPTPAADYEDIEDTGGLTAPLRRLLRNLVSH